MGDIYVHCLYTVGSWLARLISLPCDCVYLRGQDGRTCPVVASCAPATRA